MAGCDFYLDYIDNDRISLMFSFDGNALKLNKIGKLLSDAELSRFKSVVKASIKSGSSYVNLMLNGKVCSDCDDKSYVVIAVNIFYKACRALWELCSFGLDDRYLERLFSFGILTCDQLIDAVGNDYKLFLLKCEGLSTGDFKEICTKLGVVYLLDRVDIDNKVHVESYTGYKFVVSNSDRDAILSALDAKKTITSKIRLVFNLLPDNYIDDFHKFFDSFNKSNNWDRVEDFINGMSVADIADKYNVSKTAISDLLKIVLKTIRVWINCDGYNIESFYLDSLSYNSLKSHNINTRDDFIRFAKSGRRFEELKNIGVAHFNTVCELLKCDMFKVGIN